MGKDKGEELSVQQIQGLPRELIDVFYQFWPEDQDSQSPLEGLGMALPRPPSERVLVLVLTDNGHAIWVERKERKGGGFQAIQQASGKSSQVGVLRLYLSP